MTAKIITLPAVIHAQSDCAKQLAERFLCDAMTTLEKRFKDDLQMLHMKPEHYAARHPEIVGGLVQAQATAFQALTLAEGLREIREAICEQFGELLSVVERVDATLSGIEQTADEVVFGSGGGSRVTNQS